jgi:hypothetical protein
MLQSQATGLQETDGAVYPYEILKVHSKTPIMGIDVTRREVCFFPRNLLFWKEFFFDF